MVRSAMTRDGRTLDHGTLATIPTMAVERVREGERPRDVIAHYYRFHRCTIYQGLKMARGRGHGLHTLAARPATGRPRTLTARQERQVFAGSMERIRGNMGSTSVCERARSCAN